MKISTALEKIDEHQLFVPAFQREYGLEKRRREAADQFPHQQVPHRHNADVGDGEPT